MNEQQQVEALVEEVAAALERDASLPSSVVAAYDALATARGRALSHQLVQLGRTGAVRIGVIKLSRPS